MWWYLLALVLIVVIILLLSWVGLKTNYSAWQIKQKQAQTKSTRAKLDLERLSAKPLLVTWQILVLVILFVALSLSLQQVLSIWQVLLSDVLIFTLANILAKAKISQTLASRLYYYLEKYLLRLTKPLKRLNRFLVINSIKNFDSLALSQLESFDELMFIVNNSPAIIDDSQRRLMSSALKFNTLKVEAVMTPFDEVMSLSANDLIGPLVLDDLHRTGYDYFPVLNQTDEVVGILNLSELVSLENKTSQTAQELCNKNVLLLHFGDSLMGALQQLLTEQALVAVVERRGKPVGLIRLNSIIASLIGDKI